MASPKTPDQKPAARATRSTRKTATTAKRTPEAARTAAKKATPTKTATAAKTRTERAAERARREMELERKRQQALDLRAAGATYEQIAQQLGYANKGGAWKAVEALLAQTRAEKAEQVMELELHRLDQMQLGLWAQARAGNNQAVDRVLKIMDRRAKYLNLDHPQLTDAVAEGTTLLAGLAAQLAQLPDSYEAPK